HGLANEICQGVGADVLDHASHNIALATDSASNGYLAGANAATAGTATLANVAVLRLSADESFVHLYDAAELSNVLDQCGSDLVTHEPSSLVRTESKEPKDLQGAD